MEKKEIKKKLKECFKNCAMGRIQLRKCIVNAMNKGLVKEDVISLTHELESRFSQDDTFLVGVTAIGQVIKYEEKHGKKPTRENIKNDLKACYKKCALARRQLRKCIVNSINAGLTKEDVLAYTDEIVGGLGKNEVSACAIVAVDQILRYEENKRAKPIDILKERVYEKGDI